MLISYLSKLISFVITSGPVIIRVQAYPFDTSKSLLISSSDSYSIFLKFISLSLKANSLICANSSYLWTYSPYFPNSAVLRFKLACNKLYGFSSQFFDDLCNSKTQSSTFHIFMKPLFCSEHKC